MRAVSRRVTPRPRAGVRLGDWVVDLAAHRVRPASGDGDDQKLTPTEWRILEILVRNPGRLITKQQLLHEVWGPSTTPRPTTCASTSRSCAASSSPTPPARRTS